MIVGFSVDKGWLALVGFVALISGIVVLVKAAPISVKKIDDKFVWINGVCRPFLEMLPEPAKGFLPVGIAEFVLEFFESEVEEPGKKVVEELIKLGLAEDHLGFAMVIFGLLTWQLWPYFSGLLR